MKIEKKHITVKPILIYGTLALFIFLAAFLSTHHNHAFGEMREDCPAYILTFTFNSADDVSFTTPGTIIFYHHTFLNTIDEICQYTFFYSSKTGRSPPITPTA